MSLFNFKSSKPSFELKALPMDIPQFQEWSYRIIKKANLPTKNIETQQFALAGMILQSSPTEFFRPDEYYVDCLRKAAADQLAMQIIQDMKDRRAKEALEQTKKEKGEATPKLTIVADEKTKT